MSRDTARSRNTVKIVKSNELIKTSYQLGLREQLFVLYLISQIDSMHQGELDAISMTLKQIKEVLNQDGVRRVGSRQEIFDIMNNLNQVPIVFEDDRIKIVSTWISSVSLDKQTDTFSFYFDKNLKPYLLHLNKLFTEYAFKHIKKFKSSHAIRMYEICKMYQFRQKKCLEQF